LSRKAGAKIQTFLELTKFFSPMDNKKAGLTHAQVLGIIWLSAALLIIAGVAFFSPHPRPVIVESDTLAVQQKHILTQKEGSTDQHRYAKQRNYQKTRYIKKEKRSFDTTFYTTIPPVQRKQPLHVDLNNADTLTLQLIHGIGPAFANRIVRYRERLGGFVNPEQLLEVYGFTPTLLNHIEGYLEIDSSAVKQIDINHATLKELTRHPYMEYYQARDIVRLRDLGTHFGSIDDLRAIPSMADSTLKRLLPYLKF